MSEIKTPQTGFWNPQFKAVQFNNDLKDSLRIRKKKFNYLKVKDTKPYFIEDYLKIKILEAQKKYTNKSVLHLFILALNSQIHNQIS